MTFRHESLQIGGEFEFNPDDYARRPLAERVETNSPTCLWIDTGRSALLVAATAIRKQGGLPRVWLPAYCCESIARPFTQAEFEVRYYPVGRNLQCGSSLPQPLPGESLLFIDYFGHRNWPMVEAAPKYINEGVWVIEDRVHASLSVAADLVGSFSVTSDRKVLPVPDGATISSRAPLDLRKIGIELSDPDEAFVSAKLTGKILRAVDTPDETFLALFEEAETRVEGRIVPRSRSWLSCWMSARLDREDAARKRRMNWLTLLDILRQSRLLGRLCPVMDNLGEDDVPLGMPVRVVDDLRDSLRAFLTTREIYCPVHWPLNHLPADSAFSEERQLQSSLLTLPTDQRMSSEHLEYFAKSLVAFFEECC